MQNIFDLNAPIVPVLVSSSPSTSLAASTYKLRSCGVSSPQLFDDPRDLLHVSVFIYLDQ